MGFEIYICLFGISATAIFVVECDINSILDKSLLDPVNFSHAYLQNARDLFISRTSFLILAFIAPKQNQRVENFCDFWLPLDVSSPRFFRLPSESVTTYFFIFNSPRLIMRIIYCICFTTLDH